MIDTYNSISCNLFLTEGTRGGGKETESAEMVDEHVGGHNSVGQWSANRPQIDLS